MMGDEIEEEKKFTFNSLSTDPKRDFEQIRTFMNLGDGDFFKNNDVYHDENDLLDINKINVRYRSDKSGGVWTVKKPLIDQSSIYKRNEKNFPSMLAVIEFLQKEWNVGVTLLEEQVTLNTHRTKYNLTCFGGIFELVFDETIPENDGVQYSPSYMIEVELKKGSSVGLYFITKSLLQFPFIEECNLSKKEIALKTIAKELGKTRIRSRKENK